MTKKRLSASFEIRLPNLFKLCILPNQNDAFSLYKQAPTEILNFLIHITDMNITLQVKIG